MKLNDWIAVMERIAPPELALEWDNVGLIIGTEKTEIHRVLVALDCTAEVAREAAAAGADLVLTHHPQFFQPVRRLRPDAPDTAAACILLKSGVAHYAAHTNLDTAKGGVNDALCALFGVTGVPYGEGMGRIGRLPAPMTLKEFAALAADKLAAQTAYIGNGDAPVHKIAFLGGAGGSDIQAARAAGAEAFLTGELKYNEALDARFLGLNCVTAGHFETERIVLKPLIQRLQAETDDVQYTLAQSDNGPFVAV